MQWSGSNHEYSWNNNVGTCEPKYDFDDDENDDDENDHGGGGDGDDGADDDDGDDGGDEDDDGDDDDDGDGDDDDGNDDDGLQASTSRGATIVVTIFSSRTKNPPRKKVEQGTAMWRSK